MSIITILLLTLVVSIIFPPLGPVVGFFVYIFWVMSRRA